MECTPSTGHAELHGLQLPSHAAYLPAGQPLTHLVPSKIACTVGGQAERLHGWLVHAVHSVLRGPLQRLQEEWHGRHTRSSPE